MNIAMKRKEHICGCGQKFLGGGSSKYCYDCKYEREIKRTNEKNHENYLKRKNATKDKECI